MQFRDGATVCTADGEEIGRIDRVVLKPATMEVTHVVVRKGFFFTEDKVVPVHMIGPTTEERVTLRAEAEDLESLPDYQETDYIEVEHNGESGSDAMIAGRPRSLFYYPPIGVWRAPGHYVGYDQSQYVRTIQTNIPEDAVALQEGARVITDDDQHVGNIERIFTEPLDKRATHFIITQGLFFKERKLIPTDWLSTVSEEEVHLSVDSEFVERLPEYQLEE